MNVRMMLSFWHSSCYIKAELKLERVLIKSERTEFFLSLHVVQSTSLRVKTPVCGFSIMSRTFHEAAVIDRNGKVVVLPTRQQNFSTLWKRRDIIGCRLTLTFAKPFTWLTLAIRRLAQHVPASTSCLFIAGLSKVNFGQIFYDVQSFQANCYRTQD